MSRYGGLRWKRSAAVLSGAMLLMLAVGCGGTESETPQPPGIPSFYQPGQAPANPSSAASRAIQEARSAAPTVHRTLAHVPRLTEQQQQLGIDFVYDNGAAPERRIVETTGGGAGWLDFDCDGDPDLYLVQGGSPMPAGIPVNSSDRLMRNQTGSQFQDVTEVCGISEKRYGQGIAVGDFDGDGFDDILVTNVGPDTFYRNLGDGTFQDQSVEIGVSGDAWSTSAAWADPDADGDLDLFVCNYLAYDPEHPADCRDPAGNPMICHPGSLSPLPNQYYVNDGSGTLSEQLLNSGLDAPGSKSLGLVIADLNGDGRSDVYVANDTTANHLFLNQGGGQFVEEAATSGCAANGLGQFQASMGVAMGDYDQDGFPDLYVTHFTLDYNTLYRGMPGGRFLDATRPTGLVHPTLKYLGFGCAMTDWNSDGHMDLMIANGHIDESFRTAGDLFRMPPQLFSFNGSEWEECGEQSGDYFRRHLIGRAIALADYDGDGDADAAVVHQNSPTAILQNTERHGHWLKLRFVGSAGNRRGTGVRVQVTQGGRNQVQQLAAGTSYCASHEPCLHFGLGDRAADCQLTVTWPDGSRETRTGVRVDQQLTLHHRNAR